MTLGDLVLNIVEKLGVKHIFGVPGDYNLRFLDYIVEDKKLNWIGNCNELNASYAADGYARENGIGVLVTTSGVGELSAANGIAGSYAHNVPVLHLVGYPNSSALQNDVPVHHTLANFKKDTFLQVFSPICGATAILSSSNYVHELQRVISNMLITKKPGYIGIPTDLVDMDISETLEDISFHYKNGDDNLVAEVGQKIIKRFSSATKPVFLVGVNAARFGWRKKMTKILQKTQAKFVTTLMGKSIVNETSVAKPNYLGIYSGDYSTEGMVELIQSSDCIISIGTVETDLNSGGFSEDGIDYDKVVTIRHQSVKIGKKLYSGVSIELLLDFLLKNMIKNEKSTITFEAHKNNVNIEKFIHLNKPLNQKDFWPIIAQEFIKKGDIVVAEAGSSLFGLVQQNLPEKIDFVSQILWASIGYTLPSAIGSAIASKNRRVVLFIGDGSFQLTAQEVCLITKHNLNISIFLINNDGYTIERAIHGKNQPYNDIPAWDYLGFAKALGITKCLHVDTFQSFLAYKDEINATGAKLIEFNFDKFDYPPLMQQISKKLAGANEKGLK